MRRTAPAILVFAALPLLAQSQQQAPAQEADPMASCPMHAQHMAAMKADGSAAHGHEVDSRHDSFGMSHQTTHHNFRLFADGGAIELRANAADDAATVAAIRAHLQEIAPEFRKGDFSTPLFVHGKEPAGVKEMSARHDAIDFRYEEVPQGGRIHMVTKDPAALAAVHEFLKFQVVEHRTGDSGMVERDEVE